MCHCATMDSCVTMGGVTGVSPWGCDGRVAWGGGGVMAASPRGVWWLCLCQFQVIFTPHMHAQQGLSDWVYISIMSTLDVPAHSGKVGVSRLLGGSIRNRMWILKFQIRRWSSCVM